MDDLKISWLPFFKIDTSLVQFEACWEARSPQRSPSPWLSWLNGLGKIPETMVFYPTKEWCCPRFVFSFWGYSEVDHGGIQNGIPSVWIFFREFLPPTFSPGPSNIHGVRCWFEISQNPQALVRRQGAQRLLATSNWSRRDGRTMRVWLPEGVWFFPLG